jgi:putative signal transducing protein
MKRVRFSAHPKVGEARLLAELLTGSGLSVEVRGETLAPLGGEIPSTETWVELWLPEEEVARARELLAELEEDGEAAERTVSCPRCQEDNPGNFELCWSCGVDLPSRERTKPRLKAV